MGWGQLTNHAWRAGLYSFSEREIEREKSSCGEGKGRGWAGLVPKGISLKMFILVENGKITTDSKVLANAWYVANIILSNFIACLKPVWNFNSNLKVIQHDISRQF